ncbi:DDE-type integrase/transposase/recombinase [Paraburkholderia youngii]|uniref:DDE-type integrase/transposase/recombinase n=1 Tax=Paraburkholderia youngii TaxID=2782701 RepID=UPI0015916984|nr:DDE-type integrase/transposase/recombinase [Paraburkholderia youngii]NUX57668.1 transposase family protein [Paraburkholderia youngii]
MRKFDAEVMFELFETHSLPARTRELIVEGFRQPARWTTVTPYRAPADLPCPKMGFVIHAANPLERKAAIMYQFRNDVFGYLDSPFALHVKYEGKGKRPVQFNWPNGFLLITAGGFIWEDWAPFSSLVAQCKSKPGRFVRDGDVVRSPPLEEAARRLGLEYRLRSDLDLDPLACRNREFLRSYLVDAVSTPAWFRSELREYFRINAYGTLEELRQDLPHRTVDDFHAAIANGELTADLSRAFVLDADIFMVFRDAQSMDAYRQSGLWAEAHAASYRWEPDDFSSGTRVFISGNPFTIVSRGNLELVLQPDQGGQLISMRHAVVEAAVRKGTLIVEQQPASARDPLRLDSPLRFASTQDVDEANAKLALLEKWEVGTRTTEVTQYSDRSYRTWRRLREDAIAHGIDPTIALLSGRHDRGNRTPRLDAQVEKIVCRVIKTRFDDLKGRGKWSVFGDLKNELKDNGLEEISKQTFLRRVLKAASVRTVALREGRKAAYQAQPFYWWLERDTPVHGDFPMQWVHIDHTPLEIEVVSEETGEGLGRPTLTLVVCAFSRRVIGFYLALLSPRYISCMAAVLDMIRRTGRVPDGIIYDGGAEFFSVDFEGLLSFLRVERHPRKCSAPRDGALLERMFGFTQTMLIHQLDGNTKARRNIRQMTRETDPSGHAKYTLAELYDGLEEIFCDIYEKRRHGTLLMSPAAKFEAGLERSGQRLHRLKRFEDCIPHAFPSVRGHTRTIDAQRGVRANYGQYHNARLESPMFHGLVVPTKYHPLDPKVIYVFVGNEWIPMILGKDDGTWQASTFFNMAHLEERRMLESLTRDSQSDANMRVSRLIAQMESSANDDVDLDQVTPEPALPHHVGADNPPAVSVGEEGAGARDSRDSALVETMKGLLAGGYRGARY